ncbi:MAG: type IX secretion system membrane protein PorP/SprF [Flavobacteriales bacterium]
MFGLKKILIVVFVTLSIHTFSQDPQFSQFYSSSLYLNPAFTGNTNGGRISGIYRNQWAAIPGAFISYSFAYDHNLQNVNSGLGLMVTHDKAGSGGLRFTNVAGLYAYALKIKRKLFFRAGLKFSYTFRGINESQLLFADQIIRDGASSTVENFADSRISYFDAGTGGLLYSDKYWIGFSLDHINQPEQSLIYKVANLPIKTSIHGGYNFALNGNSMGDTETSITAAFNYKNQLNWNQLDLGAYYNKNVFVIGLWYRGIPIMKTFENNYNNDALVFLAGIKSNGLSIGYSYDITISRLSGNTGGSHEVSLVYEYPYKKKRKRRGAVPCAKF